jgi:hypothetical protein
MTSKALSLLLDPTPAEGYEWANYEAHAIV